VIGILTHLLWDGFTHESGVFVQSLDILNSTLVTIDGQSFKYYRFLQHLSSLIGLVMVILWIKKWSITPITSHKTVVVFPKEFIYLSQLNLLVFPVIIGICSAYLHRNPKINWLYDLQFSARHGILSAIGFFLILWLLLAIFYRLYFYKKQ
jgi:hypothetical protein